MLHCWLCEEEAGLVDRELPCEGAEREGINGETNRISRCSLLICPARIRVYIYDEGEGNCGTAVCFFFILHSGYLNVKWKECKKTPKHSSFKKLNPFQERKVMTETCFCFDLWPLGTRAKEIIIFYNIKKKPSIINICKTTQRFRQCQIYQLVKFSWLYLKTLKTRIVLFFLIKWKLPLDLSDTRCSPLSWFELETLCQIKISYINF